MTILAYFLTDFLNWQVLWSKGKYLLKLTINESRALVMVGGFTKKVFPIDCVITYFSQSIVNYLLPIFFQ